MKLNFITIILLSFLLGTEVAFSQNETFTVVLDAGHGGKDPGNLGNKHKEKDIVLKIVLKVGKILAKNKHNTFQYLRNDRLVIRHKKVARMKKCNETIADRRSIFCPILYLSFHTWRTTLR